MQIQPTRFYVKNRDSHRLHLEGSSQTRNKNEFTQIESGGMSVEAMLGKHRGLRESRHCSARGARRFLKSGKSQRCDDRPFEKRNSEGVFLIAVVGAPRQF